MNAGVIGIIIVSAIMFFLIGGVVVYFIYQRSLYKHVFRIWSSDLKSSRVERGRISVDKENKSNRVFTFKMNPSVMVMRDPTHWVDGKPERWVIVDETGEYQYLGVVGTLYKAKEIVDEKTGESIMKPIDDARYMKTRLHPIDKQLALEQMRNNQKRYEYENKANVIAMLSLVALCAVLIIGMIYGISVVTKNARAVGESSKDLKDMSVAHDAATLEIVDSMRQVTDNLVYIYAQSNADGNNTIVIPVPGVKP